MIFTRADKKNYWSYRPMSPLTANVVPLHVIHVALILKWKFTKYEICILHRFRICTFPGNVSTQKN